MLSGTLVEGLRTMRIGGKIRTLRLKKKMGLVELGQHSGLSPRCSRSSKGGASSRRSDAAADRARLQCRPRLFLRRGAREAARGGGPQGGGVQLPERQDRKEMSYRLSRWTIRDRAAVQLVLRRPSDGADKVRLHTHAGVEFIYTLKGRLNVHIDGQEHALDPVTRCTSTPAFPWVPPQRHLNMLRRRGYDSLIAFSTTTPPAVASEARRRVRVVTAVKSFAQRTVSDFERRSQSPSTGS